VRTAPRPLQFSLAWLLAYIAVVALVCGGLVYGRHAAFQVYGTDQAQREWWDYRVDVAVEGALDTGPVKRRVPKSSEPPALVLMRDYFLVCLVGAIVLSSVLFGTFMVLIRGALKSPKKPSFSPEP
jgi:hypothetical protein